MTEWKSDLVSPDKVAAYRRDGAICLRGLFTDWTEPLRRGVAYNEAHPSEFAADTAGGDGRFFGDYCNWRRIGEYEDFIRHSVLGPTAAALMESRRVRMFHEHVLIKEPGTGKATPWHHDLPYYNVQGDQTISFWLALDPVDQATCPRFVAGSHLWGKLFYPRFLATSENYDYGDEGFETVPDIDASPQDYDILSWELAPGDALCFSYKTLHGAPANLSQNRRRGFSARLVGDDARYASRQGETSPPLMDIGLVDGDLLGEDCFPTIWERPDPGNDPAALG